jgi:hypothetical protein
MPRMSAVEKAMHLETAPRSFQPRVIGDRSSSQHLESMMREAEQLTKADAIRLAQTLLVHVHADGIGYEDVQSAQAVTKYVGQAVSALRGLALS